MIAPLYCKEEKREFKYAAKSKTKISPPGMG
jgi:hypothetical protein